MNNDSKFILVTGRAGVGKSAVCDILREFKYTVFDSDAGVKDAYNSEKVIDKAVDLFGMCVLDKKGKIDVDFLRNVVFRSENPFFVSRRRELTRTAVWQYLQNLSELDLHGPVFVEAALTEEVGWARALLSIEDVIVVQTNASTRQERLKARQNVELIKILDSRQDEKYLSYVEGIHFKHPRNLIHVLNNGSIETLRAEIMKLLKSYYLMGPITK